MADEALFADLDELANHGMGLDARAPAQLYASLNLDKWPDKAVVSDVAFIEIDGVNDDYPGAE